MSSQRHDLRHLFPRSLNVNPAVIGARAYCGHRRSEPWDGGFYTITAVPEGDLCVVCVDMAKAEGWG